MVNISNNGFIYMHRGDSFKIPLVINQGTKEDVIKFYISQHPSAEVYFGLMEPNQRFEEALIKKHLKKEDLNSQGDLMLKFNPEDTENLIPSKYYYALKAEVKIFNHQVWVDLDNYSIGCKWEDEIAPYNFQVFQAYLNTKKELIFLGQSKVSNITIPLYAKLSLDETYLSIYGIKAEDDYSLWIGDVKVKDLWDSLITTLDRTIVDTIVPSTDFLIME